MGNANRSEKVQKACDITLACTRAIDNTLFVDTNSFKQFRITISVQFQQQPKETSGFDKLPETLHSTGT